MFGFGAPDSFGANFPFDSPRFDWGFGDPEPGGWAGESEDWGFGDLPWAGLLIVFLADHYEYPDDGGELVRLTASWPEDGPYRVRLVHRGTGQTFPDITTQYACTAPLKLDQIRRAQTRTHTEYGIFLEDNPRYLSFVLPPLPTGIYDVNIAWGASYGSDQTIPAALRVVYRGRCQEQWRLRQTFPAYYTTGPRDSRLESLLIVGDP